MVPLAALLDLTSDVDVTTALLDDPLAWRVRVVEQIDVDSPVSALRRRSLQCAPLRPVLDAVGFPLPRRAEQALVVLPVAPVPKGPLLEFDLTGPDGSDAFLLQRADIASAELALLKRYAARAGLEMTPDCLTVVEAALGFTEAYWPEYRPDVARYLADGVGLPLDTPVIETWRDLSDEARAVLEPFADVPSPVDSPVENPALIVPSLLEIAELTSPAHSVEALTEYVEMLAVATDGARHSYAAEVFVRTLIEYGTHYELLAVVRVPLDEPFLVKSSDRRELRLTFGTNTGEQSLVIADARSNHVALRVLDPNARLASADALTPAGDTDVYGTFTARATPQVHSAYAFEADRDYRITLRFRVAALRRLQLVPYGLGALLFILAGTIIDRDPGPGELTVLAGPGALAASVLLAREPSALGSRLRLLSTSWLIAAVSTLVLVAGWQYVRG